MRRIPALGLPLVLALVAMACGSSEPASGLMLALDTDMTVPQSIDQVGLYLQQIQGTSQSTVLSQEAAPIYDPITKTYSVHFAASFAIQSSEGPNVQIRARFVGYGADGAPLVMREARTQVPTTGGIKRLPLPLLFVNSGRVEDTQAGTTTTGTDVGLQVTGNGTRANPFERFRHPECQPDETLGDDGACTSIDVAVEALEKFEASALEPACLDVAACFGGERGVRTLPINADCTILVPAASATELAVAVRTSHGYAVGTSPEVFLQPLETALYTYDPTSGLLALKPAACRAARADGFAEAWVSVKCAPKTLASPTCGAWRSETTPAAAPTDAAFSADGPPVDASVDSSPDGALDASETEADAGLDGGASVGVQFYDVALAAEGAESYGSLITFAATRLGNDTGPTVWALVNGLVGTASVTHVRIADTNAKTVTRILGPASQNVTLPRASHFELGANANAYLISPSDGASTPARYVVSQNSTTIGALSFTDATGDSTPDGPNSEAAVATFQGHAIAVHLADKSSDPAAFSAGREITSTGDSFTYVGLPVPPTGPADFSASSSFGRGATFGNAFWIPAPGYPSTLLRVTEGGTVQSMTTASLSLQTLDGTPFAAQSLFDLGGGAVMAVGRGQTTYGAGVFALSFDDAGMPVQSGGQVFAGAPGLFVRNEAYAGSGSLCMRVEDDAQQFYELLCAQAGQPGTMFASDADSTADLHVSGDADSLYIAKRCRTLDADVIETIRIASLPWAGLDSALFEQAIAALLATCPYPTPS